MRYLFILIVISLTSCQDEMIEIAAGLQKPFIDPIIKPHVESFVAEARARGISVNTSSLKIMFLDIETSGRTQTVTNTILINPNGHGWKYNPEAVVFHELGHLYLKRDHLNKNVNKFCVSIMSNQDDPVYDINMDDRLYNRRLYYVDELFNPKTPLPEWMY